MPKRTALEDRKKAEPIGIITEVHGPVSVIACDSLPPLRQALCAYLDNETYLFETHQHLDERHVRAITLHRSAGLRRGMTVYDTGAPLHVPVTPDCLGRLLNIFGEPLDGGDELATGEFHNVHSSPLPLKDAVGVGEVLETGNYEALMAQAERAVDHAREILDRDHAGLAAVEDEMRKHRNRAVRAPAPCTQLPCVWP